MFSVTSHAKSKSYSYRPFHAFSVHFSLYWISSTHINTMCFSEHIYGPHFSLVVSSPTNAQRHRINTIFLSAPIQIEATIDLLELRNLPWWETLQKRKGRWYPAPLMPWNPTFQSLHFEVCIYRSRINWSGLETCKNPESRNMSLNEK